MKIEITDIERDAFIEAATLNLDYMVFETNEEDAADYSPEILGTLAIFKYIGNPDDFHSYLKETRKIIKKYGDEDAKKLMRELFPETKEV